MSLIQQRGMNMFERLLEEGAQRDPSRVALLCGSHKFYTYQGVIELANRAANALKNGGCRPGDRVLIALSDSVELIAAFFGTVKAGAIAVLVSPRSKVSDFVYYLKDAEPQIAILGPSALSAHAAAVCEPVQTVTVGASLQVATSGGRTWEEFVGSASGESDPYPALADHPAALLYTSGSVSRQKGVLHSHQNFIAANRNIGAGVFGYNSQDRVLSIARMFFSFGLGFGMCFPLAAGATIVANPDGQAIEEIARCIDLHRPSILAAVPSFYSALLKAAAKWLNVDLSSIRIAASAGEPLPESVREAFGQTFGVEIVDGIGSTELLTHFISTRPGKTRPGSLGTVAPGCTVRLVKTDGELARDGEIGLVWVKSESQFLRYWNQPELTSCIPRNDWVLTGDQLYRDANGYFTWCGRQDDMLKVAGMWVSPGDLESALCTHSSVERALVTTKEDKYGVRRIVAYVVPTANAELTPLQLLKHLAEKVPEYMLPSSIVVLADLPLTLNGKPNRGALPTPVWADRGIV